MVGPALLFVCALTSTVLCEKRSDDPIALSAVVEQLVSKVNDLTASKTALQNEVASLKSQFAALKCQSGRLSFRPHEQDVVHHVDGNYDSRSHSQHITFSSPFLAAPQITAGIVHIDSDNGNSADRIDVGWSNVNAAGFDMAVTEWMDTHNWAVDVSWMACVV